ncbi:lipid IV(A) 3-deoxy-D-manno-octulosonic acid transferase [Vibrio astriarenae]
MTQLIRYLYTGLLALISPILLWGLYRKKANKPKFGPRWKEHFGFTPTLPMDTGSDQVVWIHAVSVGEVLASKQLILTLKERYPSATVLVTTTTSTGAEQVGKLGNDIVHRYMPIDFSWCVRLFLKQVKPSVLLVIETEVWPNTIHTVAENSIPILLVNARLSDKSYKNYAKLKRLIIPTLERFDKILTVHDEDRRRFKSLGVLDVNLTTMGSLKYDLSLPKDLNEKSIQLRQWLGVNRPVFIATSTHQGEDEVVIGAYQKAKRQHPTLLLILVPRHPERFNPVFDVVASKGLVCTRRTENLSMNTVLAESTDVYLADTMGEMLLLLAASDLVFMGGSLLGQRVGGHNFIEPAILSKPCLTGESFYNFAELGERLIELNALKVTAGEEEISDQVVAYFNGPHEFNQGAINGMSWVKSNSGALEKCVAEINNFIEQ